MSIRPFSLSALALALLTGFWCSTATAAVPNTLKVYMLIGQSNMEGQAYAYDSSNTANWNVVTMQYLLSGTSSSTNYLHNMPASTYTFKNSLNSSWLQPRNDAWAVHYDSEGGALRPVLPTNNGTILNGVQPLQPGFGAGTNFGTMIGPELGMGTNLGDHMQTPILLAKSDHGGTDLAYDWRPPTTVAQSGGSVGQNYTDTVTTFKNLLNGLNADLADDGKLNKYNNATGYEVCGIVWLQGWNTVHGSQTYYSTSEKLATYQQNLVNLINDLHSDLNLPDSVGTIVEESSDQDSTLNAARQAAVAQLNAAHPGSAVFVGTSGMRNEDWGNNEYGVPFTTGWGYHFNASAANVLQLGWSIGQAAIDNGYTGTDPAPEPATLFLITAAGLPVLLKRRRSRS